MAAKKYPTEKRNVVAPPNVNAARRAVRARLNDRLIARDATDANVQEASEHESENEQPAFIDQVQSALRGFSPTADESVADFRSTTGRIADWKPFLPRIQELAIESVASLVADARKLPA
jgi:uncharacterized protein (DUF427 family)